MWRFRGSVGFVESPRRPPRGAAWAVVALALLPAAVGAAPPRRFTRLSVEQGLSQNTVQAILQDHVGFLWLGTEEGLNRFDGYAFVVFKHDPADRQSLPDDLVSALHEDRQRQLWVGTGHGLSLFDRSTETFTRIPSIRERVNAIVEDPDGTLWVGTEGGGLFEGTPGTATFIQHQNDPQDPASLGSNEVIALLRDRQGRIWIGTRNGGIDRLQKDGRRFLHHRHDPRDPRSLGHDEVWDLAEDSGGNLWVATYGGGLSARDPDTGAFRHRRNRPGDPTSLGTDLVTSLLLDRSGTLWIGTDGAGVRQYDAASDRFVPLMNDPVDPTSLSRNVVRALYEDIQGHVWVGTYLGGANVLDRPRRAFRHLTHSATDSTSLANPVVNSFLEDHEGRIWVGTWQSWLHRFDRQAGTFERHRFPSSAVVGGPTLLSLHEDRRGRIWVGTYRGGLGRFDPLRGTFTIHKHEPGDPQSLANDEVWTLAEDASGELWVGTNAGLDRLDPDRGVVTARYGAEGPRALSHARVRTLLRDRQGNLWVGTLAGLNLFRPGTGDFQHYRHDDRDPRSLSNDGVVALREDRRGRLWVGTYGGGLNLLDPAAGTFTAYKEFPSNVIYGIEEEPSGRLWLSTNQGLSRFDPETGAVENFDVTNGLHGREFLLGASLRTRDGRLLFGSADGFYDIDPEAIRPDTYAPPVVLTSLRVFNEPVQLPTTALKEVTLSHRDKVFSLEFAALDYTLPRRNRYAYTMEGFSDQWIELGTKREVTFTNLDPRTYLFRVKASNSDSVWNEPSAVALRVVVRPPFWGTWWFRALSGGMVLLVLLAAHRLRVGHLTADIEQRRRAQEAEAALRSAVEKAAVEWERTFDSIEACIAVLDGRGTVIRLNRATRAAGGPAGEEGPGRPVTELGPGEPWRKAAELAGQVAETGRSVQAQVEDPSTRRTWDLTVTPVQGLAAGEPRAIVVARDVSRVVELQESLRRSETMSAMGSLLAGVAHEVRNPLFGISANLDLFEAHFGQRAEYAQTIAHLRREVNRLADLIHDLFDFGRPLGEGLEAGSLKDVVAEAMATCEAMAGRAGVELRTAAPSDLPPVQMDRKRLVQAFENLVRNAIQHSPAGSAVVAEAAAEMRNGTAWIHCTVEDSGPGFAHEDLPMVFQPFFTRRRGGTGLGLPIVQRVILGHGGTVAVGNRPCGGGRVTVRLPCA